MGCGSSKDTVTVVNVAPTTRTKTVNNVVKGTPAQFEASANDEEQYNTAHQSSDAKEEEEQTIEEPMQPVVQDLGAGNAEGDAPEEHKGDERLSSNETKDDKSTEEPVQIKQDTANDEEHNDDEQLSSNETKDDKSTEEPVQIKQDTANDEEHNNDEQLSSNETKEDQSTEEPVQIKQDTANDEEHNDDEQPSSNETKEDKSTEEPVQIKQVVHQHDWMAAVSESEREGWLTTCSMCGTKDDVLVVPPMAMTSDGLMTYDVESAEGDVTHVVCKPKPYSDEETYAKLDAHAVNADRSLNSDFTELVTYLLQPARTDLEKARVLFRWGTAQDLVNMQFPGTLKKETPEWYLREIKEERESHVTLLARMCSLAGLQNKIVRGHAKSVKFYPGSKLGESNFRGSWPQVLLDGRWGIMDTAWGSHHVIDDLDKTAKDLETVYAFDEFHFLPDPRHYLSSHIPDDDKYQFLSNPAPLADFEPHVQCWPHYFVHHLKLLSHHHGLVPTENGKAVIYIGFKPEHYSTIKFTSRMQTMDRRSTYKDKKLDQYVRQERKRDAVVFIITPPEKGKFLLDIFSSIKGGNGTKRACEYAIDCEEAMSEEENLPHPEWQGAWGPGVNVLSKGVIPLSHPTHVVDCPEGRAAVQFSLPEQLDFNTFFFETTTKEKHLKRYVAHEVVDGVATFNVINPLRGNLGLAIYATGKEDKGKTLPHLCTYLVSTDSPSEEVPFPSVAEGRFGPCLPHFTEMGMSTKSHASAFIECDDGELQVRLSANKLLTVSHDLTWETLEEKVNMNNYCYSEVRDGEVYFWLRLPRLGKYKLAVYAEEIDHEGSLRNVYNYCINCTGTKEDVKPFPPVNGNQWGQFSRCAKLGLTPTSHPTGFIEVEEELELVLDSTKSLEFTHHLKHWTAEGNDEGLDDFCCHKVLNEGKRTAVLVRFPHEGDYVLELYAKETGEEANYQIAVNYLINCKKSAAGCVGFPKVWNKRWGPLYPDFSSMGLSLASHTDPMIHSRTGALQISLGRSEPLRFLVKLFHYENGQSTKLPNNIFIQDDLGDAGKMTARLLLPHIGDYKLQVNVLKKSEDTDSYPTAINYLIHCSNAVHGSLKFPRSFSNWGQRCQVHEPQMRTLPAGQETQFKVVIPDAAHVAVIPPKGKWSYLKKQEDGTWEGDVTIPGGDSVGKTVTLSARRDEDKRNYSTFLEYIIGEASPPVSILWEGIDDDDEVSKAPDESRLEQKPPLQADGEENDSRNDEESNPLTEGEREESEDKEEPKLAADGGQNDASKDEEETLADEQQGKAEPKTTTDEKNNLKGEEDLQSPTDEEQDKSRNEEESKPSRNDEESNPLTEREREESEDKEEPKLAADGGQNDASKDEAETVADEQQFKAEPKTTTDEEGDFKDEEDLQPPTDEEQDKSRNDEESKSSTEGQEEAYKVVLRQHQATIEATMSPEKVIPRLEQEGFVDDEEATELLQMVPKNVREVNRNILTVVTREGEDAFVVLRDVMEETGQNQIVELIQHVEVEAPPDDSAERVKRKLRDAMKARNSKRLQKAITEYKDLGLSPNDPIYMEAEKRLEVLERLLKHRHAILKMEPKTVSEIRRYNRPQAAVQQVMAATLLLLGNSKKETEDWQSLRKLIIGGTGKESLQHRVKKFQPNDVPPWKVAEAKAELKDLTKDHVHDVSAGAATFFVWVTAMIADVEGKTE